MGMFINSVSVCTFLNLHPRQVFLLQHTLLLLLSQGGFGKLDPLSQSGKTKQKQTSKPTPPTKTLLSSVFVSTLHNLAPALITSLRSLGFCRAAFSFI